MTRAEADPSLPALTPGEKLELLARARRAAARALGAPPPPVPATPPEGRLGQPGAAFVTWRREGRLRGCIGSLEAFRSLTEDVEAHAVDALVRDPRFAPATARDLARLSLEISVLGPLERVQDPNEVVVGVHGLFVRKGARSGLLLPQVPVEWGWDLTRFLEQTCLKAGLPADAWSAGNPPAEIYRFSAEVFGESA